MTDPARFAELVGELRTALEDNERVSDVDLCVLTDDTAIFGLSYGTTPNDLMPVSLSMNVTP